MALKYWIKKKILRKEYLIKTKKESVQSPISLQEKKSEKNKTNKKEYVEVEKNILFAVEKLLGQPMTERQVKLVEKCYNEYDFDEEMILYLVEYCSNESKTDARYMGAVASSWFEQKAKSIDDVKRLVGETKNAKSIKKDTYHPDIKIIKGKYGKKVSRTLNNSSDRKEDYNKIFLDSISNRDFK